MASDSIQWLVITDLDGTFLNHHDYSFQACLPALDKLRSLNIPVIFNTSKTFRETIELQQQLKVTAPFIVENGSALYLPVSQFPDKPMTEAVRRDRHWQIISGETISGINGRIADLFSQVPGLVRLSTSTPQQVSELTGLTADQAVNAIGREFSEPVMMKDGSRFDQSFIDKIHKAGLATLQGGRFLHVLGECDKGKAIEILSACYNSAIKTIVLGDSANDVAMLMHANIPVVVKAPGNTVLLQQLSPPFITTAAAPEGWTEGIEYALHKISEEQSA
jgi:mannosyl-3-phosphoglycerate phosphatase